MNVALFAVAFAGPALLGGCGGSDDEGDIDLANGCDIKEARCQRAIFTVTAEVRGDVGARLPSIRTISVQEYADSLQADVPSGEPDPWSKAMPILGLLPEGGSVDGELADSSVDLVAAYYDTRTKGVTVLDRGSTDAMEDLDTLSHEFVHALQDAELGLGPFMEAFATTFDSIVATKSLIEGEAQVLAAGVMARVLGEPPSALMWQGPAMQARFFELVKASDAPLITAFQVAPYVLGIAVGPLWQSGGQDAIRALHSAPRLSALDWAEDTQLSAASRIQPLDCYPTAGPPGFQGLDWDSFGPVGPFAAAVAKGDAPEQAWSRALGVRGDRMVLFADPTDSGSYALAWRLRFDTEANAMAFSDALSASAAPRTAVTRQAREVLLYGTTRPEKLTLWTDVAHCGTQAELPSPDKREAAQSGAAQLWRRAASRHARPRAVD